MTYLLLGLGSLLAILLALRAFMAANPAALARSLRLIAGAALTAIGAYLVIRGAPLPGALVAALGWLILSGRNIWPGTSTGWGGPPRQGQGSRLETEHLEMELDHDSGAIRGRVIKGRYAGRDLDTMSPAEIARLWRDLRFGDLPSAQVLEAYLDRVHPSWRDDLAAEGGPDDGGGRTGYGFDSSLSREEAAEVLGVAVDASAEDVRAAHRELMKKVHPDRGGSNYLAAKINEAKKVLLGE